MTTKTTTNSANPAVDEVAEEVAKRVAASQGVKFSDSFVRSAEEINAKLQALEDKIPSARRRAIEGTAIAAAGAGLALGTVALARWAFGRKAIPAVLPVV